MKEKNKGISKAKASAVTQLVGGIILCVVAGFCMVACLVGALIPVAVFFAVFVAIGIVFIKNSKTLNKLIDLYKKYVAILSNDPKKSIENLAKSVGKPLDEVKIDLEKMISAGLFTDAAVDDITNTIVIGAKSSKVRVNASNVTVNVNVSSEAKPQEPQFVTVKCPGCGATVKVEKGKAAVCEYCGTDVCAENKGDLD